MSASPASRDLALIATFAALMAALGLTPGIPVPGIPVPITLQTFGVMVSGLILGPRRGASAMLVYLALVAIGLPLLPGGRGGPGPFVGPTAGYLFGFPLAALAVGALVRLRRPSLGWVLGATILGGIVVQYACGIPLQMAVTHTHDLGKTLSATAVFLPGDLVKAVIAAVVAMTVYRGYPEAAPQRRAANPTHTSGVR